MAAAPTAYLVTITEDGFGPSFPLHKGVRFTLGRSPSNRIVLTDDLCSREHAEIFDMQAQWYVRDLSSLNGSRLNHEAIRKDELLTFGDEIQIGHSRFRFVATLNNLSPLPTILTPGGTEQLQIKKRLRTTKFTASNKKTNNALDGQTLVEPQRYEEAMSILYRLALAVGRVQSIEELVELALDALFEAIPAEVGAVLAVVEPKETELLAHRYRTPHAKSYHKISQFVSSEVLSSREAILAENVTSDPTLRKP